MTLSVFLVFMILAIVFMLCAAFRVTLSRPNEPQRVSWEPLAWACVFVAFLSLHGAL